MWLRFDWRSALGARNCDRMGGRYELVWILENRQKLRAWRKLCLGSIEGRVCDYGNIDVIDVGARRCAAISVGFRLIRGCSLDCLGICEFVNEIIYSFPNGAVLHSSQSSIGIRLHEFFVGGFRCPSVDGFDHAFGSKACYHCMLILGIWFVSVGRKGIVEVDDCRVEEEGIVQVEEEGLYGSGVVQTWSCFGNGHLRFRWCCSGWV